MKEDSRSFHPDSLNSSLGLHDLEDDLVVILCKQSRVKEGEGSKE